MSRLPFQPRTRRLVGLLLIAALAPLAALSPAGAPQSEPPAAARAEAVRFEAVDIYLDSQTPVAAYQLEVEAAAGDVTIVSIEGGESPAFAAPPYYDPKAISNTRVILAALSADQPLPAGKTRVARLHVRVAGDEKPEYQIKLMAAADAEGNDADARASLEPAVKENTQKETNR